MELGTQLKTNDPCTTLAGSKNKGQEAFRLSIDHVKMSRGFFYSVLCRHIDNFGNRVKTLLLFKWIQPSQLLLLTSSLASSPSVYCLCHKSGQINVIAHKFYLLCTFDDLWLTVLYLGEVRSRDSTHTLCSRAEDKKWPGPGPRLFIYKHKLFKGTPCTRSK